jgi:predicted Zn-dependent peptidase
MTITRRGVKQARIGIGFKTQEFRKQYLNEYLSSLVAGMLLQHRLFEEVRERRGLSYEPAARAYTYSTYGFIGAEAGVEQRNLSEAEKVILKEFYKLQCGEIKKKEIDRIKNELRIGYTIARERPLEMAIRAVISTMTEQEPNLPERMPELIGRVSLDGVRGYCAKYIDVDRYGMYTLKPR